MLLYLIIIFILSCMLHYYIHFSHKGRLLNKIQGPSILPIIGNALEFVSTPVEIFYLLRHLANKYKNKHRIWTLWEPEWNIYNPQDIEVVLSSPKHITKSSLYDFFHPWLNFGLLTSTGEKWHARRKILTPAFHFNILRQFCKIFHEESEKLVQKLRSEVNKDETDIMKFIQNYTLHTICETAMGTKLDSIPNVQSQQYQVGIRNMSKFMVLRMMRFWLHPPFLYSLSSIGKNENKTLVTLHKFTTNVIKERRVLRVLEDGKIDVENINEDNEKTLKKRLAMLDLLLVAESEGKIDEEGIREEVDTFTFEGYDTTTTALTFCLMELANNPDVQDRALNEVNDLWNDDETLTIDVLNKMNYIEMCIKETLRLYPSVSFMGRKISEDIQLEDYVVPAETTCHIHIFDLHRRADLFPNPDKFDPERFTKENSLKRHPFAYIPFSAGQRNCIGQKFAVLEMKSAIACILKNYKLEPVTRSSDVIFTADIILKPKYPVKIKLVNRYD